MPGDFYFQPESLAEIFRWKVEEEEEEEEEEWMSKESKMKVFKDWSGSST